MTKKNILRYIITTLKILIITALAAGCAASGKPASKGQPELPPYTVRFETLTEKITNDDGTLIYTISYTYPIINSAKKDDAVKKLNEKFKTEAEKLSNDIKNNGFVEKAKTTAKTAMGDNKEFYPHSSTVNYALQYNGGNIMSFLKTEENYTGGTSITYYSEGLTYNVETGKEYALSDVFEAKNLGLVKILRNGFKTELSGNKEIFKGKTDFTEEEISNNMSNLKWYLSSDGIVFFFNPNTIIPDVNEIPQFEYSYTGNKSMFKIPV